MNAIIERPILTEKMSALGEKRQYAFRVNINANKIEITKAVEKKISGQCDEHTNRAGERKIENAIDETWTLRRKKTIVEEGNRHLETRSNHRTPQCRINQKLH